MDQRVYSQNIHLLQSARQSEAGISFVVKATKVL